MTAKAKHALTNEIVNVFSLLDNSSSMTAYNGCKVVGKSPLGATPSAASIFRSSWSRSKKAAA
jgi:hypothetical protein